MLPVNKFVWELIQVRAEQPFTVDSLINLLYMQSCHLWFCSGTPSQVEILLKENMCLMLSVS